MKFNLQNLRLSDFDEFSISQCWEFLKENWGRVGLDGKGILTTTDPNNTPLNIYQMECKRQFIQSLQIDILPTLKP